MIKLNSVQREIGNKISLHNSILTINNAKFDFNNLDTDDTKKVYLLNGEMIIKIDVDSDHFFMFHSGNAKRFYDINCNGILELSELAVLIDDYNAEKEDCLKNRKRIFDKHFSDGGTMKGWMAKGN